MEELGHQTCVETFFQEILVPPCVAEGNCKDGTLREKEEKKKMTSNVFSIKMAPARKGKDKSWQPLALVRQKEQEIGTASVLGESPHGFLPLGPTF